jgi:predicted Fe-S protein YdhL (DUF1289 family)|tara:strand:+ start:411 stop:593 length:183 start_codon:yes stop_codon:yes gene_type:complete
MIPQSPCIGICTIEDNGVEDICIGCGRTMDEITNYPIINTPENIAKRNKINKQALIRLAS